MWTQFTCLNSLTVLSWLVMPSLTVGSAGKAAQQLNAQAALSCSQKLSAASGYISTDGVHTSCASATAIGATAYVL